MRRETLTHSDALKALALPADQTGAEPVLMCWSGGKDSSLALHAVLQDPRLRVETLLTTVTEGYERISMHGVRCSLLMEQVDALSLPLEQVRIPMQASNASYEAAMRDVLTRYQARAESFTRSCWRHKVGNKTDR